ncbi:uncharacterized protein ATNIH1004_006411 [Aspergillus tanneri]|uniref:Rhodopsin domain-containing protein n=1 Tax=Aspergillus tanneri TaxID=1220188 RepID=A0A5M9MQR3_9EURO|nr:uncharacterized protein ATNIH1004_006411 [Aspergillus tanneri]KAA8647714.1 hypothetical protein ATNIH1004_006411 [Aspergillus tanneri]
MASTPNTTVNLQESQQGPTLGVITTFVVLAILAMGLRLSSRRLMKLRIGLDDYLCILGLCLYAYQLVYATAILFIKTSILAYYKRIFSVRPFRITVYIVGAMTLSWWIAVVFISIFSCKPIHGFWDKSIQPRCVSSKKFYIGNAVPNIMTDVLILAMPIRMVWNLQASRSQKISLSFIFLLGSFVVICSCVRLSEQFKVDDPDFTWAMNGTVIWTSLEVSFGIISACLPTMRPLLKWGLRKFNISVSSKGTASESTRVYGAKHGFESLASGGAPYTGSLEAGVSRVTPELERKDIPLGKIYVKNDVQVGSHVWDDR